jgi:hypothetical protein
MHIQEMEEGEGAFSHDKEAKGQNISVGNAETESNGHKGRGEQETLIETVRSLRIEVQSYKEDNERLIREQNQINYQVMQSLNKLAEATKSYRTSNEKWIKNSRRIKQNDYYSAATESE